VSKGNIAPRHRDDGGIHLHFDLLWAQSSAIFSTQAGTRTLLHENLLSFAIRHAPHILQPAMNKQERIAIFLMRSNLLAGTYHHCRRLKWSGCYTLNISPISRVDRTSSLPLPPWCVMCQTEQISSLRTLLEFRNVEAADSAVSLHHGQGVVAVFSTIYLHQD